MVKTPKYEAPPVVTPPPEAPKPVSEATKKAASDVRTRAALSGGRASTILTGAQGIDATANTTKKTLLGA